MEDLPARRGEAWEHDPGPPRNRRWARMFAEAPDYRALGTALGGGDDAGDGGDPAGERFRWHFGPVFYRGRLGDDQVKVLVVGQDGGSDEALAHRSFVGESGTRVQHLLGHLGITRSYLFLNTFVYSILGQFGGALERLALDPASPVARHRNRLLDYAAARNDLRLIIAVGRAARESVLAWNRWRGGTGDAGTGELHRLDGRALGPQARLVDVVHPGAAAQGSEALAGVTASFAAAAERVLGWAGDDPGWLPVDRDGRRGGVGTFRYDRAPIPLRDLPFGTTRRLGAGGTVTRRGGGRSIEIGPPAPAAEPTTGPGAEPPHAPTTGPAVEPTTGPGAQAADARPTFPAEPAGGPDGYDGDVGDLPWEPPRSVIEYDRGPSASLARLLVGSAGLAWPDFAALGVPGASTYGAGPRYRGRFSGVRLMVLADQDGHDDLVWGRAFTGEAGQRFQGLLAALGITRSYLVLRTLPVDTAGLPDGKVWALADRPDVVALLAAVADRVLDDNPVAAVVTIGPHAERIAARFELDGQPVVALPPWSAPGARAAWVAGLARLRSLGIPIDQPPTRTAWDGERAQIPRADLPFGLPRWQGTSGDRVVRSTPPQAGPEAPPEPAYKVWAPRWLDTHRTP
jgi:uracil-DNA glycosylase